jgi:hypothetical protein
VFNAQIKVTFSDSDTYRNDTLPSLDTVLVMSATGDPAAKLVALLVAWSIRQPMEKAGKTWEYLVQLNATGDPLAKAADVQVISM